MRNSRKTLASPTGFDAAVLSESPAPLSATWGFAAAADFSVDSLVFAVGALALRSSDVAGGDDGAAGGAANFARE
jgi:hypothetical protein